MRKRKLLGTVPDSASIGVLISNSEFTVRIYISAACLIASAQRFFSTPACLSIERALSSSVLFIFSANLLNYGVYADKVVIVMLNYSILLLIEGLPRHSSYVYAPLSFLYGVPSNKYNHESSLPSFSYYLTI